MDYTNPINKHLIKKGMTQQEAFKRMKNVFGVAMKKRGIKWTMQRYSSVKLGYDETPFLRECFCKFFGISDKKLPRKNQYQSIKSK